MSNIVDGLNSLLGTLVVVNQNTRNLHWNLEGDKFFPLHAQLDENYEKVDGYIDMVAERIRKLSAYPKSRLADFLELSRVDEAPEILVNWKDGLTILLAGLEVTHEYMQTLIKDLDLDVGTEDMLIEITRAFEKDIWMFKSMLK